MGRRTAWRVCNTPGCPEYTLHAKCDSHRAEAEAKRGTARQRGYGGRHEAVFRPGVLAKHPTCVCTTTAHGHANPCGEPSKHADHWPLDRRELQARGLDPNDPAHGRGLCASCHSKETANNPSQIGGFRLE